MAGNLICAEESSLDVGTLIGVLWDKVQTFCPTLGPERLQPEFCSRITFHVTATWRARGSGRKQKGSGLLPAQNLRLLTPGEVNNPAIPGLTAKHLRLRPTSNPIFDVKKFASQPCFSIPIGRMSVDRLEVERVS